MNVDQCKWRKKMMGRGVDGGCGAEEKPCRPIRKANLDKGDVKKEVGIDFLAQASKNLSERSPFDVAEDGSTLVPSVVPSLPVALANLLNQSDNHKRKHKKSAHSGAEKKKKKSFREKLRSGSIWIEHDDYFRRLELPDLETLSDLASLRSLSCGNCLSVPESVGIQQRETDATAKNEDTLEEIKNFLSKEIVKEEEDVGEPMNVDNVKVEESVSCGSLEWVLGCRNRILLTSERPSKKRKLLGGDAGLGKLMVATPCEGNGLLCDFCCTGEAKEQNHQLIVCHSCKATVHRKCYGVLKDTDKLWLCSWCKLENGRSDSERPCLLCPKKGGIMKPVLSKTENGGSTEFAHLFCSMWMPEVYIEDLKKMEPILNVPAIKETRRKLLCNLCKVKSGACIRCCNGTCRTSFHPLCAREAGNRLEVWGTHGCDTVELRAFCSKHSDIRESGRSIQGRESNAADSHSPVCHLPSESVREGHPSNDEIGVDSGTPGTGSDISRNSELREIESPHSKFNCSATDNVESGMSRRSNDKEITMSKSGLPLLLKKFIDMGKVDVKEVAAEFGVNPDALSAKLTDGDLLPDLLGKVIKWVSQNTHMGNGNKDQNLKSKNTTKSKPREAICTEGMEMLDSDILDPTVTKAFPLERTLESNNCNNKQDNMTCSSAELFTGNGIVVDEAKIDKPVLKKEGSVNLASDHSPQEQKSIVLDREVHLGYSSVHLSDDHGEQSNSNSSGVMLENAFPSGPNGSQNCGNLNFLSPIILDLLNHEAYPGCSPHPYLLKELSEMGKGKTLKSTMDSDVDRMTTKTDGSEEGNGHLQGAGDHTTCCNHQSKSADCGDTFCQICKARKLGILGLSPEDEVEGELLYYQLQLLGTAVSRKHLSDNLVYEVAKKLPLEVDEQHGRRWDDVLVKKYFHDVREARKQGRKEQRHKQAQAVLAAATAAAATSSRNTSLRKDMSEEPGQQEMSTSRRKVGSSHPVPQTKETLLKAAVSLPPSDKRSDNRAQDFSVENPRTCDICRRSETIWNLIVVCSSCKVAVHMDCYKCAKESTGPWYCELCAESSSGPSNIWEQPYSSTECAICGGTTGAFRKATNGQWIHAFCAEWSLESTFRRGQINPVQGMESLAKNMDTCCVCQRKYGSCSKCSYGNCQSTFHPSCARSVGFHMTGGGKLPHKAYCEKHSLEQKAKAESQKYGAEEQKTLKHYRVELERLRLLCERIVKREKLKRELAISSHEILAAKRDHAARSLHVRNPFSLSEVSSDSATTSIKGHPDSNISGSEARQRSDDITIDSTASVKLRGKGPILPDTDQKTDDSATSKGRVSRKQTERQILSGKTVPRKHCIVSPSVSEDGDGSKPKKHVETFAKELVMTSDEASFKNRRLPKGYFYVPVDRLQEDKPDNQKTASSGKPTNQKSSSSGDQSGKDG